jgi:hypothetical protein
MLYIVVVILILLLYLCTIAIHWLYENQDIWETELFDNVDYLKCVIKQRLEDQFLQNWNSSVQNSPKSINYKTFQTKCKYEEYLNILEIKYAILLCRFRTTNNKFPIEICLVLYRYSHKANV